MSIDRAPWNALIDDDGSNLVGLIWNKDKIKTVILDPVDAALLDAGRLNTVITSTDTGTIHNWVPRSAGYTVIQWNGAADAAFTGLAGGVPGQQVTIKNIGAFLATFARLSSSSATANQFANLVASAPTPIAPGGWITYIHTGTNWVLVGHEQGAWISRRRTTRRTFPAMGRWSGRCKALMSGDMGLGCPAKPSRSCFHWRRQASVGRWSGLLQVAIPGGFTSTFITKGLLTHLDNNAPEAVTFSIPRPPDR